MSVIDVKVPDIGDFKNIPIIEVHVKPGDTVKRDDPLITLESDKAAMEVPAPTDGQVAELLVKIGDKVSEGSAILRFASNVADKSKTEPAAKTEPAPKSAPASAAPAAAAPTAPASSNELPLALDVDLTQLAGTGEKGRVTKDDVKRAIAGVSGAGTGSGIPEIPAQDFAKFGPIEIKPMSRLKRLSGPHLHRAWLNIPHVTHTDEADITDIEAYRKTLDAAAKDKGYRVTLLAFLMKASVVALKEFPEFNASLAPGKDSLIFKRYYNIGVAVDTPDGLVVPVVKEVDRKGIIELSQELGTTLQKMRDGKIAPADIQGATFSISSLGGIGGTAILGVVKAQLKPKWDGQAFQPRLMLPLCLSYDHRVIDGALAARFTRRLADILEDVRQLVL
jgi:pyruvate dehydrogenase E2 component (dihydrolipoamide acetyltransferase)